MSQPWNMTCRNVRKHLQSWKSVTGKIARRLKSCINHSEDSKVSPKVKKQNKPASTANIFPNILSSSHESCPAVKEDSSSNFVTQQVKPLNSFLQIETILHENRQGSDADNVNDSSHVQNHESAPEIVEANIGASAPPSSNTTLSKTSPIKSIKTVPILNYHERLEGSRSEHIDTTCVSQTARLRENNINSYLYSSESTNENLTTEPMISPNPARETAPQVGRLSYESLGIITGHPEKPEYATEDKRRRSFEGWPSEHHLMPDDLAKAGFYYSGYSDSARCFYCNGGLRLWEEGDDVWVEHARWFPQCEFLRQTVGCLFIDVVQELKEEQRMITYEDVLTKMETRGLKDNILEDVKSKTSELDQDTGVKTMLDAGFPRDKVIKAASYLQQMGKTLAGDLIYEEMMKQEATSRPRDTPENVNDLTTGTSENVNDLTDVQDMKNFKQEQETYESLKKEIAELRLFGLCKICMDKKVSVVFLPCGHLISCQDCSYALKSCPICRNSIKGIVRAYLS